MGGVDGLREGSVGALGSAALVVEKGEDTAGRRGDEIEAGPSVEGEGGLPA